MNASSPTPNFERKIAYLPESSADTVKQLFLAVRDLYVQQYPELDAAIPTFNFDK